jgi:competence/damage-inducible protein CinA-like protein
LPSAEIVTIGTELLLGEIVDTNTQVMARRMRELGFDLRRTSTVGDNTSRIAAALRDALDRADIVLASGGLGPTVDDVTREAVAEALSVTLEYRPELWDQVVAAFRRFGREPGESNRRQAYVPAGGQAIENPVGTAPAFYVEADRGLVVCLPGVPRELTHLLDGAVVPLLRSRYPSPGALRLRVVHTAGIGESDLGERIGSLLHAANPTIGLAAHPGQVDVRITAKAESGEQAEAMLRATETTVRERLERWIYGVDETTLVCESGTGAALIRRLEGTSAFAAGRVLPPGSGADDLDRALTLLRDDHGAQVALGLTLRQHNGETTATLIIETPAGRRRLPRRFGGHPLHGPQRCATLCLAALKRDLLR